MGQSIYGIAAWQTNFNYSQWDIISYNNYFYYCVIPHNSGLTFNGNFWNGTLAYNNTTMPYFFFVPSYNSTIPTTPKIRQTQFSDGYQQVSKDGINNILLTMDLTFDLRSDAETRAIIHFLTDKAGSDSFLFVPPEPYNVIKIFKSQKWETKRVFLDNNTTTINFQESVV